MCRGLSSTRRCDRASSSIMRHELAVRLLMKAVQDEVAVDGLVNDVSIADEVIGFHLQQATEKLLKLSWPNTA